MSTWRLNHWFPLFLPGTERIKTKDDCTQASTANVDLRVINNLEQHRCQGYLVSGHIEIELLVVHGIEAPPFDARVCFGHARTVAVQCQLDVGVWSERNESVRHWLTVNVKQETRFTTQIVRLTILNRRIGIKHSKCVFSPTSDFMVFIISILGFVKIYCCRSRWDFSLVLFATNVSVLGWLYIIFIVRDIWFSFYHRKLSYKKLTSNQQ